MRLAERHRDDGDWRAFCRGLSPRTLTEWLLLEEDAMAEADRADLRAALIVQAFTGKPVDETLQFIAEFTTPVLDLDELAERKIAAKQQRVKKRKAQMGRNRAIVEAAKAERNGNKHRPLERTSDPGR